ncbi:ATP-dependent DNA helicase [Caerostris extrusa]|uniref:ATP-dependent DNA helicase n=1 Tax=Caerostris extrusa TaxID=172846 RepID=A0AAV4QDL1_CAEEX|nr:ATP-dependent DNA helicase [Caerostris extrusa]
MDLVRDNPSHGQIILRAFGLFGDLMELLPVRGHQVFQQPEHMKPATHLWRKFRLVELKPNMCQQGDTTLIDVA